MKTHDSGDDFLKKLYRQAANEKPPISIDQQILNLAKTNHQQSHFAKVMSLQGIFSVAAVMVFSIYIVFEIDKNHTENMHQDLFHLPQSMLMPSTSSPSSVHTEQQPEVLDSFEQESHIEQRILKQTKKLAEKINVDSLASDVSELSAKEASARITVTQDVTEYKLEDQNSRAKVMLKEIEELLAAGRGKHAANEYKKFKALFPKYKVPKHILEAMDNQLK